MIHNDISLCLVVKLMQFVNALADISSPTAFTGNLVGPNNVSPSRVCHRTESVFDGSPCFRYIQWWMYNNFLCVHASVWSSSRDGLLT